MSWLDYLRIGYTYKEQTGNEFDKNCDFFKNKYVILDNIANNNE